ncbi:hypothetical protein [Sphingomonas sp. PR090111-T3T-6A]|uniref:hypothetical protein n=1 Tax=Sphingomonas sp. PR090111-T3T-6A TaxID=685778 RepID=UPI0003732309|nr:hypothetical protein [Sphingomonas sp. PR090111-T3T-6A]
MTGSLHRAAPIRFLIGVVLIWTVGRGVVLAGWRPDEPAVTDPVGPAPPRWIAHHKAIVPALLQGPRTSRDFNGFLIPNGKLVPDERAVDTAIRPKARRPATPIRWAAKASTGEQPESSSPVAPLTTPSHQDVTGKTAPAILLPSPAAHASRWSGSAWLLARGGGQASPLAPGGQIGGGQAGVRILYHLDEADRLSLSGRFSRTVGGPRQTEAATGLDWQPARTIPLHLMLEHRFAIDRGGRNAWTAGAATGVYAVPVAKGWRLDAYAEAGVVGIQRRDLYADGAARVARSLDLGHGRSLALGGGAWGAAQPGAARLDLGPSAVLRLPVAQHAIAIALDWRQRVAGGARPGSGPALTLASDF